MERKRIEALIEALEADNLSAVRQLGREWNLNPEALLIHLTEAAGVVYATKREPKSNFFNALMLIGQELDSPGITWGIIERKRREKLTETKKNLFG